MRHNGGDSGGPKVRPVSLDLLGRQWPCPPLVAAFCEELHRPAANLSAPQRRQVDAPRDRHVRTEEQVRSCLLVLRSCLHPSDCRREGLILMEPKPLGEKPPEAGLVDQIEGMLLPGKQPQRQPPRGGHHLRGLPQREVGLADRAHRRANHEPKLPQLSLLLPELLSGWHSLLSYTVSYQGEEADTIFRHPAIS